MIVWRSPVSTKVSGSKLAAKKYSTNLGRFFSRALLNNSFSRLMSSYNKTAMKSIFLDKTIIILPQLTLDLF
jgi:hypothetical protein